MDWWLLFAGTFFPNSIPSIDATKVTPPITTTGKRIGTSKKPKLNPTTSASMLVATESPIKTLKSKGLNFFNIPSGFTPSIIIFIPIAASKPNAIQWSTDAIRLLIFVPKNHPMTGKRAWKKASDPATKVACLNLISCFINPHDTETAKESKLNPMPIKRKVMNCVIVILIKSGKNKDFRETESMKN